MNGNVNNISELIKQKVSRYLQKPLHKFFYRQRVRERERKRERGRKRVAEDLAQLFSCEFCETSKNTFSYRTPLVTASVAITYPFNSCTYNKFNRKRNKTEP